MLAVGGRLCVLLLAVLASGTAEGQKLSSVETDKLRLLYFDPTETYLVPRVIQTFHDSADRQKSILGYDSDEKTTVLLTDFSDYGNAGANSVPLNSIIVDIAPIPMTFETAAPAERMYTIMNHELVHISTTDQAAPADIRARKFFGGKVLATPDHPETILYQYLTAPRKTSPRWYLEGMAVFLETWMAGGLGRAQGAYDEMVFRSMVRDDAHFYDPLGLVAEGIAVDFQVGANAYLYGARFITYLAYEYSPNKVVQWATRTEGSRRSYEEEFERVFGKELNAAWQEWIAFEHEFQSSNLQEVREYPITSHEQLTPEALGSVSRAYYNSERDSLIAGFRKPGVVAHIGELSLKDGTVDKIKDIKGPMIYRVASVAYDDEAEKIFYTTDNYAYRDLVVIDQKTNKSQLLLRDVRIGEIVLNPVDKSLWGIRHLNGYASLVRIPPPYDDWELVKSFSYGTVVYDLDISPDGRLLSGSFGDFEGKHTLQVHVIDNLIVEKLEPIAEYNFGDAIPESFVFSRDGQYLYGSSYYTGVSNIFRFGLANETFEAISNAETGYFRPIPMADGTLIVFSYTGQGFIPVRIKAEPIEDVSAVHFLGRMTVLKHPVLRTWQAKTPEDVTAEDRIVSEGYYTPIKHIGLESIYPTFLGYKDSVSVGFKANFSDPIRLDTLKIGAAYSTDSDLPSSERPNISIDYRHNVVSMSPLSGAWNFGARLNYADFYDLFGPTKRSRKGNRFLIGFEKTLIYDGPRRLGLTVELNHYTDMDSLPRYQNVPTVIDKLSTLNANLGFSHIRKSLGAVDGEKGYLWNIGTSVDHVDGDSIPKILGNFDFGFALPWRHSSIWLRNAVGAAFGEPDDEFANFFFGGFGNNYVARGVVQRYREHYALPGFEINQIAGRNFHRAMLELNLPPIRFERVGTPGFYLSWARPAIFVSSLATNVDNSALQREATNAGFQIDFRFTILSRLDMTLSLGYAKGFGNSSIMDDDEFMASLKIL
jgi:hypothetical protein